MLVFGIGRHCKGTVMELRIRLARTFTCLIYLLGAAAGGAADPGYVDVEKRGLAQGDDLNFKLVHRFPIDELRFLQKGRFLASVGSSIRIWDCETGTLVQSLVDSSGFRSAVEIPMTSYLATLDQFQIANELDWYVDVPLELPSLRIWDLSTGLSICSAKIPLPISATQLRLSELVATPDSRAVYCVVKYIDAMNGDGNISSGSGRLLGWRVPDLQIVCNIEVKFFSMPKLLSGNDGTLIAHDDHHLMLYSTPMGRLVWTTRIADVSGDREMTIVLVTNSVFGEQGRADRSRAILFAKNVSSSRYTCFQVDVKSGMLIEIEMSEAVKSWLEHSSALHSERGVPVHLGAIAPGGDMMVQSAGLDRKMSHTFFNDDVMVDRRNCGGLGGRTALIEPSAAAWSEDGKYFSFVYCNDEAIHLFDTTKGARNAVPKGTVTALGYNASGTIVAGFDASRVEIHPEWGSIRKKILNHKGKVTHILLSENNSTCAFGNSANLDLWDISKNVHIGRLAGPVELIAAMAIRNADQELIVVDFGGRIWISSIADERHAISPLGELSLTTHGRRTPFPAPGDWNEHCFIPESLISISQNAETVGMFLPMQEHGKENQDEHPIESDPGRTVIGSCFKGLLTLYMPASDRLSTADDAKGQIATISVNAKQWSKVAPSVRHTEKLMKLHITHDGHHLLLGFESGRIIVADLKSGILICNLNTGRKDVLAFDFISSEIILVLVFGDGTIQLVDRNDRIVASDKIRDCHATEMICRKNKSGIEVALATRDSGIVKRQFILKYQLDKSADLMNR